MLLPQRSLALKRAEHIPKDEEHAGFLLHGEAPNAWGAFLKWSRRWFFVANGCLCWRKSQEQFEIMGAVPLRFVREVYRCDNVKGERKYEDCCIAINTDWTTVALVAETPAATKAWYRHLCEAWERAHAAPRVGPAEPEDGAAKPDALPLDAEQASAYETQIAELRAERDV